MKKTSKNYDDLLEKLFKINLNGGVKLGLSNMERACAALNHPEKKFKSIHIAGTNGKGSVATKIAHNLGTSCGLFTSPHIASFRERITIGSNLIPTDAVERLLPQLFDLMPLTFFEITTLLAFLYFAEQRVEYAVFEVGLGGRFDATNVLNPELTIITSISLDHTEILGTTLEEIAREKGGIIKTQVPLIMGPRCPNLLQEMGKEKMAPYFQVKGPFKNYDEENSQIAKKGLELLGHTRPYLQIKPRCRFEVHGDTILDVAHNPDGANELIRMLKQFYPNRSYHFIMGLSKTKDIDGYLEVIKPIADSISFVEAKNGRGCPLSELKLKIPSANTYPSVKEALESVNALKVVTGTFFIMQEALEALGKPLAQDDIDMNERLIKL